jgi:ABC-2 type transport system ATP-binding protein
MIVSVQHLNFEYPDKKALDDVSFEIGEGAITALVGPNGAGKTTLLRCMAALIKPISGTVTINGIDAIENPREAHRQIGYLSDNFGLYDQLTVRQSLQFTAFSRIGNEFQVEEAIQKAIQRSGVESFLNKKIGTLSRGMRQRVGIAQAIVHEPKVLLLDEPASGLDPEARYSLSTLLRELRDCGMVIIVSSHILAELEDYSTGMLIIEEGRVAEHKMLSSVLTQMKQLAVKFTVDAEPLTGIISGWDGVSEVVSQGNEILLKLNDEVMSKGDLLKKLIANDMPVEEVAEAKADLQEIYIKTVQEHKKNRN